MARPHFSEMTPIEFPPLEEKELEPIQVHNTSEFDIKATLYRNGSSDDHIIPPGRSFVTPAFNGLELYFRGEKYAVYSLKAGWTIIADFPEINGRVSKEDVMRVNKPTIIGTPV